MPPPRMRTIDPTIPEALDQLVARCLEPDPAARFQTTRRARGGARSARRRGSRASRTAGGRRPGSCARARGGRVWPRRSRSAWRSASARGCSSGPGRATPPAAVSRARRCSVLIADFDNQANDPVFTGSLEQALNIAIEGASFITSYSRTAAQQIVQQHAQAGLAARRGGGAAGGGARGHQLRPDGCDCAPWLGIHPDGQSHRSGEWQRAGQRPSRRLPTRPTC